MRRKPKHAAKSSLTRISKFIILPAAAAIILAAVFTLIHFTAPPEKGSSFSSSSSGGSIFSPDNSNPPASSSSETDLSPAPESSDSSADIDSSKFSSENGRIYYDSDSVSYGIDVSKFQGDIDWERAAGDGVEFAMIRAGLRGYAVPNIVEDPMCRDNIAAANKAGVSVGLYFHSQAVTVEEAEEEALFILEIAESFDISYPIAIDWERSYSGDSRTKDIPGEDVTEFCRAFCEKIKAAGYIPAFYFNPSDSSSDLDADSLSDYIFWMAQYDSSTPNTDYDFQIWQYSNTGSIAGINGDVDLDICFTDFSSEKGALND